MPVHDAADEGGDKLHAGLGTRDGLGEGEEQCEIAVNAFFFQFLGCADAFPRGGDFDEDSIAVDAVLFVTRDERARLGERGFGVEAEAGVHLGAHAAGDNF